MQRTREGLAWAAGLYEGEGSAFLTVSKQYRYPSLAVAQSFSPEVLDRFRVAVGVGKVFGPYGRKRAYHYRVAGLELVQAVGAMLWPWLSTKRREQFKTVLASHTTRGEVTHCPKGHPYSTSNTLRYNGCRSCAECNRERARLRERRLRGTKPENYRTPYGPRRKEAAGATLPR